MRSLGACFIVFVLLPRWGAAATYDGPSCANYGEICERTPDGIRCSTKCLDSRKGAVLPPLDEEKSPLKERYQEPKKQEVDASQVEGVWDASNAPMKRKGRLNLPTIPQVHAPAYQRESPRPDMPTGVEYGRPGQRDVNVGEGYGKVSAPAKGKGKDKEQEEGRIWRQVRPDDGSGEEGMFQDPRRPGRKPAPDEERAPAKGERPTSLEERAREGGRPIENQTMTQIELRTPQAFKPSNPTSQPEPPRVSEMELAIAVAENKLAAGDYKGALQDAEAAVRQSPKDAAAWLAKAKALDALGLHPEAEAAAQQSIRLSPDYAYAHEVLAWVQYHEGKNEEAGRSLARAVELEPQSELAAAYRAYAAGRGSAAGPGIDPQTAAAAMASGSVPPPAGVSASARKAVKEEPRGARSSWAGGVLLPLLGGVLVLVAAALAVLYFARKKA
ncbi:MAG TPA: hypothetical protein DCM05_01510 [Elusimicrobia bacterium]|nr:hypothetical protein [Elusimicrobiota bacterium]